MATHQGLINETEATEKYKKCKQCSHFHYRQDFSCKQWKSGHICRHCLQGSVPLNATLINEPPTVLPGAKAIVETLIEVPLTINLPEVEKTEEIKTVEIDNVESIPPTPAVLPTITEKPALSWANYFKSFFMNIQ